MSATVKTVTIDDVRDLLDDIPADAIDAIIDAVEHGVEDDGEGNYQIADVQAYFRDLARGLSAVAKARVSR